jgi:F0F1-type ATP synthase membrane subunit b/b'
MEKIILIIFLACLLILTGCATQGDVSAVDNRLTEIELRDAEARKNREQLESEVSKYSHNREVKDQELRRQRPGASQTIGQSACPHRRASRRGAHSQWKA